MSAKPKKPAKFYIPYWQVMISNGDGSASFRLFTSEQAAEDFAAAEDEPFCDAVFPPREIEVR